jgi:hypothetical protein
MAGMQDKTRAAFETLRQALERWSRAAGHRDAYVRGSQARKDIAEQIVRYRLMLGTQGFLKELRGAMAADS